MAKAGEAALARKGRGATCNPDNRFFTTRSETVDDGWFLAPDELPPLRTSVSIQHSRTIITRNNSPDIPFSQSINPYQGCEHGCIYCYARPSHAYLDLSPGLDFESKLFVKPHAADLLLKELRRPGYQVSTINIGGNTDPYQPIEREYKVTRSLLEVMLQTRHPVSLVTKGALILRDLDLLAELARLDLVQVFVSLTTLDAALSQKLEPRASAPHRRLLTVQRLHEAGVPVGVLLAPVIPFVNDAEIESILEAAAAAGANVAGYVPLRLPYEVKDLFRCWLQTHLPLKAARVMAAINDMRGGRDNDPAFGRRMRGQGVFADLLRQRFKAAVRRHGLNKSLWDLRTDLFRPARVDRQMALF